MNLKNPKRIYNYGTYNNANNAPLSLRCQMCVYRHLGAKITQNF